MSLGGDPGLPPCFDSVQGIPEGLGCTLGGSQRLFGCFRIFLKTLFKLLAPDLRVMDVSCGMQREVRTSLLVCAVQLAQAAIFLLRHARHLRLIGVKRGQRFFLSAFAGNAMEV